MIVSGGVSVGPYDVVQARVRDDRPHRPLARRRPARQAVRVRARRGRRPPEPGAPVRAARQPGLGVRDVRAVRPAGDPAARRPPATSLRPVDRAVLEEPVTKSPGRRAYPARDRGPRALTAPRPATPRGRVRVRLAGRAGESRPLGARRRRRARRHPGAARTRRGRRGGRALVARPRLTRPNVPGLEPRPPTRTPDGSPPPGTIVASRRIHGPQRRAARRTPPPDPRRPARPAADGRRQRQADHGPPRRRRGGRSPCRRRR